MVNKKKEIEIKKEKQRIRELIWKKIEKQVVFPNPWGRIPNFKEAKKAAIRASMLEEFKKANLIVFNPDLAQKPLREIALKEGKNLIVATPQLKKGYYLIEAKEVRGNETFAASIKGLFKLGKPLKEKELIKLNPDLLVTGCVAVSNDFYRLGKGGGWGDREINFFKKINPNLKVLTTLADCQLVEKLPIEKHDAKVDLVVTPTRVLRKDK